MLEYPKNEAVLPPKARFENGSVSRGMVYVRTRELALEDGRSPGWVSQADYEQAKWELTGERDIDRQEAILEAIENVESRRMLPGAVGLQMEEDMSNDSGRNCRNRLVWELSRPSPSRNMSRNPRYLHN
jgi:hypothetical protein